VIITDELSYTSLKHLTQVHQARTAIVKLFRADRFSPSVAGLTASVGLSEGHLDVESLSKLARLLARFHGLDTPRGVGFHGNWSGTYGLMSLRQDEELRVEGTYWYAQGTLSGKCEIDDQHDQLILRYQWIQKRDSSHAVGTGGSGSGIMVIPAGYDFMYGYWCQGEDQLNSQGWSAARLAEDISEDIVRGGEYSKDFGLHEHAITNLVRWTDGNVQ